ncbi:MAG TPA: hypothetical protein VFP70_04360 [Burkholderiales bacterium]|nr:hypothetical protein [Burkholderiales bacterium]
MNRACSGLRAVGPLTAASLLLAGCATVVVAPTAPEEPVSVFLLEHGGHASLVLPGGERGLVRYAYGDLRWYALGQTGPAEGLAALLGETPAALGRRELRGPADAETVRSQVREGIQQLYELRVARARSERLRADLDGIYAANRATLVYSATYDLEFVRHPVPYSARHNSNFVMAGWLTALGCEVQGAGLITNWRVATPDAGQSSSP